MIKEKAAYKQIAARGVIIMKRLTAILTASVTALMTTGIVGSTARRMDASDLRELQHSLLTSGASAEYDLDGSGEVDVFDLILLRKELLSGSGELTEQSVPATEDYVRFQSRTVRKDGISWLIQSGSAADFVITANSAKITLAGSSGINNGDDYKPRYGVFVDGELLKDTLMTSKEETVTLWEGSAPRTAEVRVMLLSEAMYGGVGVKSIDVSSSAAIPVRPTAEKPLSIEFIGDSITCAYGVEGASQNEGFKTSTENFSKSYAYLTAQKLGADYSTCCYSGHGIVSGYTSDGSKNSESLIPDCYEKSSKYSDYGTDWDFAGSRQHDAVVINLGTNDINYVAAAPESRGDEFIKSYKAFLDTVREKNPAAFIICTVGTMGGDEVYELIEQAVEEYSTETGDKRVSCYFSKTHSIADGLGSDWHPNEKTQQNSAYILSDKICQALGIESDQIGLDMAAEAEYGIETPEGVYASHYYGYGSFYINITAGGSVPTDVVAYVSGISLKKSGRYVLSFDYKADREAEVPFMLKGKDEYYSDILSIASGEQHYEEELTASADDGAVRIEFLFGGNNSYNATISNVKLIKIG